jgi:hypothetical protein
MGDQKWPPYYAQAFFFSISVNEQGLQKSQQYSRSQRQVYMKVVGSQFWLLHSGLVPSKSH